MTKLKEDFPAPLSIFDQCIRNKFGSGTLQKVCDAFEKMGLPRPENSTEFLDATEGALLFLDQYGLVIRIEDAGGGFGARMNHTPWVLQPLGTVEAGKVIIEICPGCHVGKNGENDSDFLRSQLKNHNVAYWDSQPCNRGRLPIKMPSFPEGVPVVIDRLAVKRLEIAVAPVANALAAEAEQAQEQLYAPLRQVFKECWAAEGNGMKRFWDACGEAKQQNKLICGWAEKDNDEDKYSKTRKARETAASYGHRVMRERKGLLGAMLASAKRVMKVA